MNNLFEIIENTINQAIKDFTNRIAEKHNLDSDELLSLWEYKNLLGSNPSILSSTNNKTEKKYSNKKSEIKSSKKPSATKSDISSKSDFIGCPYLFTKGNREGECCGSKPKNGAVYCSRHKKYEGVPPKEKKVLPTSKKSIASGVKSKKSPVTKQNNDKILRKNTKIDKLWHQESGMVFKSKTERIVIGKCVDDKILPLTEDDIDVCISLSFKYEESSHLKDKKHDDKEDDDKEDDTMNIANNIAHKITAVPDKFTKIKDDCTSINKSISNAIKATKIQASDVEQILGELQISNDSDEDVLEDEDLLEEEEDLLEEEVEEEE